MPDITKYAVSDKTGLFLIVISSILLGIWAVVDTIALRNILLVSGAVIGLLYWLKFFWGSVNQGAGKNFSLPQFAPLILIGLIFCWILFHYCFLAREPLLQLDELKSTWFRSFLAVTVGSATGLALNRKKVYAPVFWLGLFMSFIVLLYQYIPKAIAKQSMFAVDWFGSYIYWAKFSGVLAGTILISGLLGMWVDSVWPKLRAIDDFKRQGTSQKINLILVSIYAVLGISVAFFSFVFIFDSKAGVGLAVIILVMWFFIVQVYFLRKILCSRGWGNTLRSILRLAILICLAVFVVGWFTQKHIKNNPGWESLFSDIYASSQIDKYKNWQNISKFGIPYRDNGEMVMGNTYERVSWAVAGIRLLRSEPLGYGTLRSFPKQMKGIIPDFSGSPYTHSAWIDIGLAFGLPALLMIFTAIGIVLMRAILCSGSSWRASVITLSIAILILYGVGEYGFQHGIEILFYFLGFLSSLSLSLPKNLIADSGRPLYKQSE